MLFVGKWSALLSIYDTIDKLRNEENFSPLPILKGR